MLFIFGIRNASIGHYKDTDHICYPCKAYDRDIQVYRSYFHFCLIPNETSYYFLKIAGITGDSVLAMHNHLDYGDFVNSLSGDDYFVKDDTLLYKRKNLTDMLERDEIFSVSRDYSDGDGFDRIR